MLTRTRRGIEALLDALFPHPNPVPERLAWAACADGAGIAHLAGSRRAACVAEPASRVVLAALPLHLTRTAAESAKDSTVAPDSAPDADPVLACAVLASAVAAFEQQRTPTRPSALGIAALVGAQAGYVARLMLRSAVVSNRGLATAAGVVAAGGAVAAWADRRLLPATVIGGAAVAATATLANDPIFRADTTTAAGETADHGAVAIDPAREGLSHGANLLLGAEGLRLLTNSGVVARGCKVVGFPVWVGERGARVAVSWAGSIGQLLLVHGLTAPDRD